jgi:metallo-beta-lactamase class B
MIDDWNDPAKQVVEPFKIFDNLYYVGINFVAAYVLETSEGLILIDSLFGPWVEPMLANIEELGLDPNEILYVLVTHGHFDHAGGAAEINRRFGATVVMTKEDWALAREPATIEALVFEVPDHGMTAEDGDIIELGDTRVELFKTPGHTEGVLSLRYPVRDGDNTHKAITLGGVGLNFTGIKRTESYLDSYTRLRSELTPGVSVSLPNHAQMGRVFERQKQLSYRRPGQTHPFVDAPGLQADLARFISNAESKLAEEQAGTATDPLDALADALDGG